MFKRTPVILALAAFASVGRAEEVDLLIRAFIPKSHTSTRIAPSRQPHSDNVVRHAPGDTMLEPPGSSITGCFLTDQRSFSSDPDASSRVQSQATLVFDVKTKQAKVTNERHPPATTHVIDCGSGESLEDFQADTSNQHFELISSSGNPVRVKVTMSGHVPAINFAPTIDINGEFTVDFESRQVRFKGTVDRYPAYEAYFRFNKEAWHTLFTRSPKDGTSAVDLIPPTRDIDVTAPASTASPTPPSAVEVR